MTQISHTMAKRSGLFRFALHERNLEYRQTGFFLADLLVGAAIGSVLVASLGGLALVSEIKFNRNALENQNLQLKWSRSLAFITNEAQQAHWISTVPSLPLGYPCSGGTPTNPLVLDGPPSPDNPAVPSWRVVYGVRSNGTNSTQWKGVNRLVRCGPSFETTARDDQPLNQATTTDVVEAAVNANLNSESGYQETFITDQLPKIANITCPTDNTPGTCQQPFDVKLFNSSGTRDRSALINLFLSRGEGHLFPPSSKDRFHAQLYAFRTPGLSPTADSRCQTATNSLGNAEPQNLSACQTNREDSSSRQIINKSYNIPTGSGTYRINSCGPTCDGPFVTDVNEMIYLNAPFSTFSTIQFAANDKRPCNRQSCYLAGDGSRIQIFDGNMLIFTDRVIRL
jgi:hypothetical protein